ncbi:MAG TPA: GSCFA domain-containing protein, partial [Chitinophagaceae bacterium]|nr:GSCFA domain-containing protein [Chitinophagaceae bacterium]
DRIAEIVQAASHKAFNPSSNAHQKFLHQYEGKTKALMTDYPYIDFSRELSIFAQT